MILSKQEGNYNREDHKHLTGLPLELLAVEQNSPVGYREVKRDWDRQIGRSIRALTPGSHPLTPLKTSFTSDLLTHWPFPSFSSLIPLIHFPAVYPLT